MRIAVYARVSTSRQQQTHTIEHQLTRLRSYVTTQADWRLCEEHIFCDDGYSGAKLKRPGLDHLRDQAAAAAFDLVLLTAPTVWHATTSTRWWCWRNSPTRAVRSIFWTAR